MAELVDLFRGRRLVLLDFDGPICAAFGARGAASVARALQAFAATRGFHLSEPSSTSDPLATLRAIAHARPDLAAAADAELRRLELLAVHDAVPTAGAAEFLQIANATERTVAIVSNNAAEAIKQYLDIHHLNSFVTTIQGRPADPSRMKPDPWTLQQALTETGLRREDALVIGDSTTDVEAAQELAIPCVGLANKPGKLKRLQQAGADAVTTDMRGLSTQLAISSCIRPNRQRLEGDDLYG